MKTIETLTDNLLLNRRTFLKGMSAMAALAATFTFGGCESILEKIGKRPTRRWIRFGSPEVDEMIAIYTEGVNLMKALGNTDARNWNNQAFIHGNSDGFNLCQHGTLHFFTWHRAYL